MHKEKATNSIGQTTITFCYKKKKKFFWILSLHYLLGTFNQIYEIIFLENNFVLHPVSG